MAGLIDTQHMFVVCSWKSRSQECVTFSHKFNIFMQIYLSSITIVGFRTKADKVNKHMTAILSAHRMSLLELPLWLLGTKQEDLHTRIRRFYPAANQIADRNETHAHSKQRLLNCWLRRQKKDCWKRMKKLRILSTQGTLVRAPELVVSRYCEMGKETFTK